MNTENLPNGSFGPFGDNEVLLKSTKDDPPKFRQDSPGPDSRGLGCFSFNRNGKELVLVQAKISEDGKRGELGVWCYDADRPGSEDDKMGDPLILITPQGVFTAGSLRPPGAGRFYSANGKYCWNYQDDGAVVLYDTHNSADESTWTAKWAMRADGSIDHA